MTIEKNGSKALLCLILIIISIFMLFPFFWMVINSFNSQENIFRIPPSLIPDKLFKRDMFSNYQRVLSEFSFGRYILNSLFVAGTAAFGQVLTCSLAGFVFALMEFKGKRIVFGLLIATLMIPVQVTIIPEYLLMLRLQWTETYLSLIIPSLLIGSFGTFMYKEFFENMPRTILDAASIDGAEAFVIYSRIYFPQSIASSSTLFIIAFMNNWNDLLRPVLYINSDALQTVTQALTIFKSQYEAQWDLLLTGSVLSILPLMAVYIFAQKYIIDGIATTGSKG